jgi:hypothetical protein
MTIKGAFPVHRLLYVIVEHKTRQKEGFWGCCFKCPENDRFIDGRANAVRWPLNHSLADVGSDLLAKTIKADLFRWPKYIRRGYTSSAATKDNPILHSIGRLKIGEITEPTAGDLGCID